jgi:hypothetical protein
MQKRIDTVFNDGKKDLIASEEFNARINNIRYLIYYNIEKKSIILRM